MTTKEELDPLEALLYHSFNPRSQLMNGTVPAPPNSLEPIPEPSQKVQVMAEPEILAKRDPVQRLPRQAAHYAQIVGHFLEVKESKQIARAMAAHFQRLARYHQTLLGIADSARSPRARDLGHPSLWQVHGRRPGPPARLPGYKSTETPYFATINEPFPAGRKVG